MFVLALIALQALASPSCQERYIDWKNPHSICHEWAESHVAILKSFQEDGRAVVVPNPAMLDRASRLPASISRFTDRSDDRGLKSIAAHVRELSKFLPANKRLLTLRARVVRDAVVCGPKTAFNAHYDDVANEIQVCPLTTHLPKLAYLPLIAHELGHVIDPSANEAKADQTGFALLRHYFDSHPVEKRSDLATYFYASVNCSRGEHGDVDDEYLPSERRMGHLLETPGLRRLARCE